MAQQTGTDIVTLARAWANDVGGGAVGDTLVLTYLNDVAIRWCNNVRQRGKLIAPSTTGLTFAAGESRKVVTDGLNIAEIFTAHPTDVTSLTYPLTPALQRYSMLKVLSLYDYPGDSSTVPQQGVEWECFAAERYQNNQDDWVVMVYPALTRARSLTLNVPIFTTFSALSDTPDIAEDDTRYIARLLAYEISRSMKENSAEFTQSLLLSIPVDLRSLYMDGGIVGGQLQDNVTQVVD